MSITSAKGFYAGGLHCGIKKKKLDLAWCYSQVPAAAAAVFTTNLFQAAPLTVTQKSLAVGQTIQAFVVNSGVANACTGEQGMENAFHMRNNLADRFHLPPHYVAVSSTGVIGQQLPMEAVLTGINSIENWQETKEPEQFSAAIMTTDLVPKEVVVQVEIDGQVVTIGGAAKGSGMINPNMATMLSYITTDAKIESNILQRLLGEVTDSSFNMIAVDGDTSTNDTVLVLANGLANNKPLDPNHPQWQEFVAAFTCVAQGLAKKIAADGEGATKLIEVHVSGALDLEQARVTAKTIILSNLVKTAMFGMDPNWGRIVCAIGYSGQEINPQNVVVKIGDTIVFSKGVPTSFEEAMIVAYLQQDVIKISVDLGIGHEAAKAWGCDLTYDYVKINASYRT